MIKLKMSSLSTAVVAALFTVPALAQPILAPDEQVKQVDDGFTNIKNVEKNFTENDQIEYKNNADVTILKALKVTKEVEFNVIGVEEADEAAFATSDNKQINIQNYKLNDGSTNDAEQNSITGSSGNLGVNVTAGDYNQQKNEAVIAVKDVDPEGDDGTDELLGIFDVTEAESFVYQDIEFGKVENTNFSTNRADMIVDGMSGNLGSNTSAGTGNQQKNVMAIAVGEGDLAEASAWNKQEIDNSWVVNIGQQNVALANVANVAGNAGINVAAGTFNQQANVLDLAVTQSAGGVNVSSLIGN
jgi:hypothetical protein